MLAAKVSLQDQKIQLLEKENGVLNKMMNKQQKDAQSSSNNSEETCPGEAELKGLKLQKFQQQQPVKEVYGDKYRSEYANRRSSRSNF